MMLAAAAASDCGRRRRSNEDRFLVRTDLGLFVVADGMGGHTAGEVAAQLAIEEVERNVAASFIGAPHADLGACSREQLVEAITSAHLRLGEAVADNRRLRGMGATIVVALVDSATGVVTLAHVGDSRAYLMHKAHLSLLTSDHSWVEEQIAAGFLSREAARSHPMKNVITRALGGRREPVVDSRQARLVAGDLLVLCSDGLNGMLQDEEIGTIIATSEHVRDIAELLVMEANRKGGIDNITVVVVQAQA
jgi:PPM family protein phosphatase